MSILSIDLETYSDVDIEKGGLYRYAENSEILLFAYAFDDEPVHVVDLVSGEEVPEDVMDALTNTAVKKTAYNAAFEMHVINHWLAEKLSWDDLEFRIDVGEFPLDPSQWYCTMVQAWTLGLPGGLGNVGKVLNMAEDKQKLATGKRLIQYFSKPCKPTKANGGRTRNLPIHDPEKWELFKTYCGQDVEAERAIRKRLGAFTPDDTERKLWCLDQKINDTGVMVDWPFVEKAIELDTAIRENVMAEARELTGVGNPNSNTQLLDWFENVEGWRPKCFDKEARAELAEQVTTKEAKRMLELKELLGKTSVKKYIAMQNARCRDDRVHGMLQFNGTRTGRWAGRLVQLQNLPQNHLDDLDLARKIVREGDAEIVPMLYDNPSDVLSQLIRTAFIAPKGSRYIVADFSAIEARVIAWIAGEKWRMKVFADGGDIYCASASAMFGVPVVKHGENGELRQKGKVAELACGYGGGVNALRAFGADKMGLSERDMESIIKRWRNASPHIVRMWGDVERGVKQAIRTRGTVSYKHGIEFRKNKGLLFITLPSGRKIAYVKPRIEAEEIFNGRESIVFDGAVQGTGAWGKNYTWGGKLTENIVQATARDCLAAAMLRLDEAGYKIVMHVHDEVILEMPYGQGSLEEATAIMGEPLPWAPGLLLTADGYETEYYRKD